MPTARPQTPLEALADLLRGFVRLSAARVLAIEAALDAFSDVTTTALGFEHHADNRAPFIPVPLGDSGCAGNAWESGVSALRDAHEKRVSEGAPLASLGAKPLGKDPASNFSVQLFEVLTSVRAPAEGVVLLLAPKGQVDPALLTQLGTMVRSDELASARFIVVASPQAKLEVWTRRLGSKIAWFHAVASDAQARATQQGQAIAAEQARGPGNTGAWPPGITAPPLPRKRTERASAQGRAGAQAEPSAEGRSASPGRIASSPDADLSSPDPSQHESDAAPAGAADLEPSDTAQGDGAWSFHVEVQRAALAMQRDDGVEALRIQTLARDHCLEQGEQRNALELELMLAGYLLKLEQPRLAAESFARASELATEINEDTLAVQARVNEGAAYENDQDEVAALRAYRMAIGSATAEADAPAIAMDAYWRAGQLALRSGLDIDCIGLWGDAVAYGQKVPPKALQGSRAKEIAGQLSMLLVRHRRYSQAREVERIAAAF